MAFLAFLALLTFFDLALTEAGGAVLAALGELVGLA